MKISEIKQPTTINEGLASALFGEVPVAALKGMFTGKGTKQQMIQDIFLKDFYQDAITSLDNGVRSGFIDPKITFTPSNNAKPETTANVNQPQNISGKMTATSPEPTTNVAVKPNNVKINMPPVAKSTTQQPSKANTRSSAQKMTPAERTRSQLQARKAQAAKKPVPVKEDTTYAILNSVFESILEAEDQATQKMGVYEYMLDWFDQYMAGVNWQSKKNMVLPYIQQIAATYNKDKGKAAIKRLANVALALSKAYGTPAAGAKNAIQHVAQQTQQAAKSTPKNAEELKAEAEALKRTKPQEYQKFVKEMPKP